MYTYKVFRKMHEALREYSSHLNEQKISGQHVTIS